MWCAALLLLAATPPAWSARSSLVLPGTGSAAEQPPQAGSAGRPASGRGLPSRRGLIQSGQLATVARYPYIAVVTRTDGSYLCAGTLVHPRVVLTAAHCVTPEVGGITNPHVSLAVDTLQPGGPGAGAGRLGQGGGGGGPGGVGGGPLVSALAALVGLGSTGGRAAAHVTTTSRVHPGYNPGNFDYDVAVLLLGQDAPQGSAPVSLPAPDQALPPDAGLTVLGWGATEANALSTALRSGAVTRLPPGTCAELFAPFNTRFTQRMMCVTGRTCAGDSGGPLVLPGGAGGGGGDLLVGHVSFGFPRGRGEGCPTPNPATVMADLRAPRINAWVRGVVREADGGAAAGAAGQALRDDDYARPDSW